MLLRFTLPPSAHFAYLLKVDAHSGDDFIGLREVNAYEEVQSNPLLAELLVEGR